MIAPVVLLAACAGDMPPARGDGLVGSDKQVTLMDSGGEAAVSVDGPGPVVDHGGPAPDVKPPQDTQPWPKPDTQTTGDDIGKACISNADCMYGLCATNMHTGVKFCTKVCDPCSVDPCPVGSGCQNAGLAYICAPGYPNAPCPP